MKERPILFSAPMVRALLAGTKTQTRRVLKPGGRYDLALVAPPDGGPSRCPYGVPGDRLWVREGYSGPHPLTGMPPRDWVKGVPIWYWADGEPTRGDWTKPKPGMHMPRWASRLTLEVTAVRVERLQDISEADAQAEGTPCYVCGGPLNGVSEDDCHCFHRKASASDYRGLWEQINGPGSWDANPWVWCVSFRRVD